MSKERGRSSGRAGRKAKVGDHIFEGLPVFNLNAAGIDIGSETHYVSVSEDRDEKPVRTFGCFTPDLQALAAWLKSCRITTVVMESTGVYWVPSYQVLVEAGFEVHLVDAHHARNVPGRKTDVWDCTWLRKLHTFGLLRGCFLPPSSVTELRAYWRHRAGLVEACSQQVLRMQKALEQMNLQLHKAISDITGVSGMRIIRAIVAGERRPLALAQMRHEQVKATEETMVKALSGHYLPEHLFTLKQAVASYDFIHGQIKECDAQIQQTLGQIEGQLPSGPAGPPAEGKPNYRRKNQPHFEMRSELKRVFGVDLLKIAGISELTAMTVLAECGPTLDRFPTPGHFASWLALCPNHRITGGKVKSRRTRRGKNRLATALCVAAQSLHHSKSAMGAFFRRMRARVGAPKAITATAHRLARTIYMMITRGEEYVEQGQAHYETQYHERQLKALQKQAGELGFTLIQKSTAQMVS